MALATLARRLVEPRLEQEPLEYLPAVHAIAELPIGLEGVRRTESATMTNYRLTGST